MLIGHRFLFLCACHLGGLSLASERTMDDLRYFSLSLGALRTQPLSLFLSPCPRPHRLSLFLSPCISYFNRLIFFIYKERILNDVVALPNNIIYRFLTYKSQNFKWAFFLHDSTSLITEF